MARLLSWVTRRWTRHKNGRIQHHRPPAYWQQVRQTLGRALRELGHALDRTGQKFESFTWLPDKYIGQDPPVRWQDFLTRHETKSSLLHCGRPVVSPQVALVAPCATLLGMVRVEENASIWYGAVLRADTCYNANSFGQSDEEILAQAKALRLAATMKTTLTKNITTTTTIAAGDAKEETENAVVNVDDDDNDDENKEDVMYNGAYDKAFDKDPDASEFDKGGGIYIGPDSNVQDGVLVTARRGSTVIGQGVTVGHLAQLHSATVDDYALIGMGSILSEGCHVETEALIGAGAVVPPQTRVQAGELWLGNPARKIRDLTAAERQKLHYQSSEYVQVALSQRRVMELGGNLTPEWTLMKAVRYNLKMERDYDETMEERIYRLNKWTQTVYRDYLPKPPPRPTAIDAGTEGQLPQLAMTAAGGAGSTTTLMPNSPNDDSPQLPEISDSQRRLRPEQSTEESSSSSSSSTTTTTSSSQDGASSESKNHHSTPKSP
ncbi:hypothetical protein ACA910_015937 [Epithemia clementina (nom. ined.)]